MNARGARSPRSSGLAERELRDALLEAAPDDDGARERSWHVVRAAYASREPVPRRRSWKRPAIAAAIAALAAVGVATASAPDSGVGRWVRSAFSGGERSPARPALASLPGGGRLLVASGGSVWAVASDGGKRRLGAYDGGSWSPHGRFAVVWRGRQLTAIEPGGRVRWSRAAPRPIALARWGPVDGFRIAYLAGAELRIVNGDGTGDRGYGPARPGVAPAWRPDDGHVLAYPDRRGRVNVAAVDTRRLVWRSAPVGDVVALSWSADGSRLFVATRRRVVTFDRAGGRPRATHAGPPELAIASLAAAPVGRELALVRQQRSDTGAARRPDSSDHSPGHSEVVVLARGRERSLFTAPGRLRSPAWSPDGRTLLVPWPAADQWLFLRVRGGGRVAAVADMARQFAPGRTQPPFPGAVEWCCGS